MLAKAVIFGVGLHYTSEIARIAHLLYEIVLAAPLLQKILLAQSTLAYIHLYTARSNLRSLPRRVYLHMATRQLDLSLGGAGTEIILQVLRLLDGLNCLPPLRPPQTAFGRLVPSRILKSFISFLLRRRPNRIGGLTRDPPEAVLSQQIRVHPSIRDHRHNERNNPNDHQFSPRPIAWRSNSHGYYLTRRCRAALPTISSLMFAFEVLLPAFAPLLTFGLLNVLKHAIIFPFRIGTYAFIRLAEVTEPFKPEVPDMASEGWYSLPYAICATVCNQIWLPSIFMYLAAAASTVFILFVLSAIAFFCTVFTGFLLVQTVRECGVRRRVSARLAADPEAELDELHDDGETQYQHDDLRIDLTRLLFDGRSVLLFIYTIFLAEEYTHQLWATLDGAFGRSHVFEQRFAFWLIPNLLYYLRGLRLPVTAVCLSSMVIDEPMVGRWAEIWTKRIFLPTGELLSHGFELIRLYTYLLLLCPSILLYLLHSLLPAVASTWLASGAPLAYIPTKSLLIDLAVRGSMALDGACILYALTSFLLPRSTARNYALLAFFTTLPAVLMTSACPSFANAHRATLYATLPPFAALLATLAPFLRPKPTAAPAAAQQQPASGDAIRQALQARGGHNGGGGRGVAAVALGANDHEFGRGLHGIEGGGADDARSEASEAASEYADSEWN